MNAFRDQFCAPVYSEIAGVFRQRFIALVVEGLVRNRRVNVLVDIRSRQFELPADFDGSWRRVLFAVACCLETS